MNRQGFTVIEIMVVLVVISILLTMGIYTAIGSQASYRDRERQSDIQSIKISLESYYKKNSGVYPTGSAVASDLVDSTKMKGSIIDDQALMAPSQKTISLQPGTDSSAATSNYIYEPIPLTCDNSSTECRSYKLHYKKETDDSVVTVLSKN